MIQRSSAVSNKCKDELEDIKKVENKNKNDNISKLESPKNIILFESVINYCQRLHWAHHKTGLKCLFQR